MLRYFGCEFFLLFTICFVWKIPYVFVESSQIIKQATFFCSVVVLE